MYLTFVIAANNKGKQLDYKSLFFGYNTVLKGVNWNAHNMENEEMTEVNRPWPSLVRPFLWEGYKSVNNTTRSISRTGTNV